MGNQIVVKVRIVKLTDIGFKIGVENFFSSLTKRWYTHQRGYLTDFADITVGV